MLTVHLHLSSGDVIELQLSPAEKDRMSRTMNQERLPTRPFLAVISDATVEIPWRSIAFLTARRTCPAAELALVPAV